jgi:predicted HAD superfamily Cof-like phosphohydrolase
VYYGENLFIEAFDRVHNSNMSKLGADGNPIRREDGKILKGPNYKAPDLTDLLDKGP